MARIACPDCAAEVSELALSCPRCGRDFTAEPSDEERVHTDDLEQMSRRAARGAPIDVLALLVGGIVTLILAYLTRPAEFRWTNTSDFEAMYRAELRELENRAVSAPPPTATDPLAAPQPPPEMPPTLAPTIPHTAGPLDAIVFALVALAALRGVVIGAVREAISLAAVVVAVIAIRVWSPPLAHWLQSPTGASMRYDLAPLVAGAAIAAVVLVAIALFVREIRRGRPPVVNGRLARFAGGGLGLAEGLLVSGVLTVALGALLGRDHVLVASHSLGWVERVERVLNH